LAAKNIGEWNVADDHGCEFWFDAAASAAADIPTTNVLCCPKKRKMKNYRQETAPSSPIATKTMVESVSRKYLDAKRERVRNNNDSKGYDVLPGVYSFRRLSRVS
jgi:hypothetical protein